MSNFVHMRLTLIALAVLTATSAHAVVLGNVRNAVYVGKAFNANIELADAQDASLCISVDLSYGDSRVSGTSYTIKGNTLRVRNNKAIDEPILNLLVTADCTNPTSRKYTLFAEAPMAFAPEVQEDETEASAPPAQAPRKRQDTDNFFGVSGGPTLGSESIPTIPSSKPARRKARAPARPPAAKPSLGHYGSTRVGSDSAIPLTSTDSAAPASVAETQPRLELSNFDWTQEDPGLRTSPELLSLSTNTDPAARELARARWAALSAQIDGLASDASLRATQQDFLGLTQQIQARDREIAALRAQLAAQENAGLPWRKLLPWLLGLLLLSALALLVQRWRKALARAARKQERQKEVWWQHEESYRHHDHESNPAPLTTPADGAPHATRFTEQMPVPEVQDLDKASASKEFPEFFVSGLDEAALFVGANQSRQATEVLLDTQQQVDFFLALGQYDKAIDILKNHINENDETSPLVYLDLLSVYHSAGRAAAFEELRLTFNQRFNANVPDFANYRLNSRGLESYGNVIARIQRHWNTPKVINLIEESVFRRPGERNEEAFEPLAYRELLLLYGIATETTETEGNLYRLKSQATSDRNAFDSTDPNPDFLLEDEEGNTALSPLSAHEAAVPSDFAATQAPENAVVDLDLDALPSTAPLALDLDLGADNDHGLDFDLSQSAPLQGMSVTHGDLDFSLDEDFSAPTPNNIKRGHQAQKR